MAESEENMVQVKFNRMVNSDELREVMALVEMQQTTDRYTNTSMHINGDYANVDVEIDEDGDITVLQKGVTKNEID